MFSVFFIVFLSALTLEAFTQSKASGKILIIETAEGELSKKWRDALASRMSKEKIDSLMEIQSTPTIHEFHWQKLVQSKASLWNSFRDSLQVPFPGSILPDTLFVLLGFHGLDDGFTFGEQTVCLDLTALYRNYGKAGDSINPGRIDRIFSHEYTHLLHKEWAQKNKLQLKNFRDSVLWECLYEGIGMYRSLSKRWLPVNGVLPEVTKATLSRLHPEFTTNINIVNSGNVIRPDEKSAIQRNLSRGQVENKWGAFPVAIWLLLEANGDDRKLIEWMNKGPDGIIELAAKYIK